MQTLLPHFGEAVHIDFCALYSEADRSIELLFEYPGEALEPLPLCGELSRSLVENAANSIEHSYDGKNRVRVTI